MSLSLCDRSAVSPAPVPLAESGCSPVTSLVTNRVERFRFCPTYQSISVRRRCTLVWVGQRDTLYCSTVRCDATYPGAMRYIVFRKLKFILCHGHIMPSSVRYTILTWLNTSHSVLHSRYIHWPWNRRLQREHLRRHMPWCLECLEYQIEEAHGMHLISTVPKVFEGLWW